MLDADYNESAVTQAGLYLWYSEFISGKKSVELMGQLGAPTTALTKQTINTGETMILI